MSHARVTEAIEGIRRGDIVIVVDGEDRENEGDLVMAAEHASRDSMAFFLRHTSGVICAPMTGERLAALDLPQMVATNNESHGTAFTVSVDASAGITTGISASDRAHTLNLLADPTSLATSFVRPGHIFPLRGRPGGVLTRVGHTEASIDLMQLAGVHHAGVLSEIVTADKTSMALGPELRALALQYRLPMISIADLVLYRLQNERLIRPGSQARIPTAHGNFVAHSWTSIDGAVEHVALVLGDVAGGEPPLVRVHSECLTGDVFGSARCDCGGQLDDSLAAIAAEGRGVVVYLRGQEGRGIGLSRKLDAYNLQDQGLDTVDANLRLGLPVDVRTYGVGAQILMDLGVDRLRLLTNNPAKQRGLEDCGLAIVSRVPLPPRASAENVTYLRTKRDRLGHVLTATDLGLAELARG
jgi:3,4-dihydroxy 2-butanone 4-phosphate synthase/GTP cyclohydrolase II